MPSTIWGRDAAEIYDATSAAMFAPAVLNPTIECLVDLAAGGPALEFAVGTGRVALALAARGVEVAGIELSPDMVAQLRSKPGGENVAVTVGDMTTTRVPGAFRLVYVVWNAITNVTTQEEQVAVFTNAAAHLVAGGSFVVEVVVPRPFTAAGGELGRVFMAEPEHVGIDTVDDIVGQIATSHHWIVVEGRLVRGSTSHRYIYPSELDLMGRSAGLTVKHRWAGWDRAPFLSESTNQVVVFEKTP